jgi:hypothetical protein
MLSHEILSGTTKSITEWPVVCLLLAYAWVAKAKKTISRKTLKKVYEIADVPIKSMDAPTAYYLGLEIQKNVECSSSKIKKQKAKKSKGKTDKTGVKKKTDK